MKSDFMMKYDLDLTVEICLNPLLKIDQEKFQLLQVWSIKTMLSIYFSFDYFNQ